MTMNLNPTTQPLPGLDPDVQKGTTATAPLSADTAQPSIPVINVAKPIKIPTGVSSNAKQHVILVLDKSSSMGGSKIDDLNLGVSGLVFELANPINKNGFLVSVVEFNHGAHRSVFAESAVTLQPPVLTTGGGTNFNAAMKQTISTVEDFKSRPNTEGWRYLRPQVLFLSDGQSPVSDNNIQDLQEIANVTAIAYGSDADSGTLSRIASDGQVHVIGTDGGALRAFLAKVGETLSQELANKR